MADFDPGEGKHTAKRHRIHLDDGPRTERRGDGPSPLLILVPLRADHILLGKNLVDLKDREPT